MKGRVEARLLFASQSAAQDFATQVGTEIKARAIYVYDTVVGVALHPVDGWLAWGECRFETRADADAVSNRVQTLWSAGPQTKRPLAGSWVKIHLCSHDEAAPTSCSDAAADLVTVVKA